MEVRPAEDVHEQQAAMAVNARAWREAYDHILPAAVRSDLSVPSVEELQEREPQVLASSFPGEFLVAVDGSCDAAVNGVVGFAAVQWGYREAFVPDDAAELRAIYVLPELWGEGVGSALLDAAVEAVPDGHGSMLLQVFEANDQARGFYEARGFDLVAEHSYEVAEATYPTVVYERPLDGE